jgi:hypothetical protein
MGCPPTTVRLLVLSGSATEVATGEWRERAAGIS